jgi:uncharacterized protein YaaW (UPF0174 family)
MRFFKRNRTEELVFKEIDRLKAAVVDLQAELKTTSKQVAEFELDYNMLYEKIRVNLAKLAKRAKATADTGVDDKPVDPVLEARRMLLAKKFGGNSGV